MAVYTKLDPTPINIRNAPKFTEIDMMAFQEELQSEPLVPACDEYKYGFVIISIRC